MARRGVVNIEVRGDINAILDTWSEEVGEAVEKSVRSTMTSMKKETKKTAPKDDGRWERPRGIFPNHRERNGKSHGEFASKIAHKAKGKGFGYESTWYVKAPEYRLTHLLVHGHQKFIFGRNTGGRVEGNGFLHVARENAEELLGELVVKNVEKVSK